MMTGDFMLDLWYILSTTSPSTRCGICEKRGASLDWPNHASKFIHSKCFTYAIYASSQGCQKVIEGLFNEKMQSHAQMEAFKAVRKACGKETIHSYLVKQGSEKLTALFNSVGIQAVKTYAQQKRIRSSL